MTNLLPADHLERTDAWGGVSSAMDYVFRPSDVAGIQHALDLARQAGVSVGFRGSGRSYGDASINAEQVLVDLTRMTRILAWDPERGIIKVEPGVTVADLWRYVIGDGWWPPVVPGTMFPSIGGCLAMNVHGKNNWHAGVLGEHVRQFTALLPTGEMVTCTPDSVPELFHAMIGGLGLLGCFTEIELQMARIHSGRLRVLARSEPDMNAMLEDMEALKDEWNYLVGWVDGIAGGKGLGRGQIHAANYLEEGEDRSPAQSLRLENQDLPDTFFGVVPKSIMWRFMHPMANNLGMRLVNQGRYLMGVRGHDHVFEQSLAEFNFLLDYIPHWKRAYEPDGLIQYQCFIPKALAADAFAAILRHAQARHLPPYLGVTKRHRPDSFLLSHAVDGYSMALDFHVTRSNREQLARLTHDLDQIVLNHDGRFYFAKDSTLTPETARAFLGRETIEAFQRLKSRCDPEGLLQSNLARRVFDFPGIREIHHKDGSSVAHLDRTVP